MDQQPESAPIVAIVVLLALPIHSVFLVISDIITLLVIIVAITALNLCLSAKYVPTLPVFSAPLVTIKALELVSVVRQLWQVVYCVIIQAHAFYAKMTST